MRKNGVSVRAGLAVVVVFACAAWGQAGAAPGEAGVAIDVSAIDARSLVAWVRDRTGVDVRVTWRTAQDPDGADPDRVVTLRVAGATRERLWSRLAELLGDDRTGELQWQSAGEGVVEIGPKRVLNRRKSVVTYDVMELLKPQRDFTEAPEIDLQSVLQGSRSGSIFREEREASGEAERDPGEE